MEKTVVLVKPDGVKRGLCGEIISRFEKVGLKIVAMKMVWVDEEIVRRHYPTTREEWVKKVGEKALEAYKNYGLDPNEKLGTMNPKEIGLKVCQWLVDYLVSGPTVALLLEGNRAIGVVRKMVGATNNAEALPGTIRGDFSIDSTDMANMQNRSIRTIVHASGNPEEAKFEEELWFHKKEIHAYKRVD